MRPCRIGTQVRYRRGGGGAVFAVSTPIMQGDTAHRGCFDDQRHGRDRQSGDVRTRAGAADVPDRHAGIDRPQPYPGLDHRAPSGRSGRRRRDRAARAIGASRARAAFASRILLRGPTRSGAFPAHCAAWWQRSTTGSTATSNSPPMWRTKSRTRWPACAAPWHDARRQARRSAREAAGRDRP